MLEFSAISVSSYEATALVEQLNGAASDGWSVVSIVPTGSTVTAYLSREAGSSASPEVVAVAPEPVAPEPVAPVPVAPVAFEKTAFAPVDITPEPAAASPTAAPATPSPAATSSGAPAGWYADPSGRFELRYWDGGQWTEHVARAGQQFTDPPVA